MHALTAKRLQGSEASRAIVVDGGWTKIDNNQTLTFNSAEKT